MARRRISKDAAPAAPAAPAPTTPEPQAPVAVAATTEIAPPAAAAPLAQMSPALASLFGTAFAPPANLDLDDEGDGLSRIGFYSGRENPTRGAAIIDDLGEVPPGTPYLYFDGSHYPLGGYRYAMLASYAYWAAHGNKYEVTKAWAQDPGKSAVVNGAQVFVKECILTIGVVVPGKSALPEALAPAVCTLDTFRGAQTRGPKDLLKAQVATTTPAWAKQGANGVIAGAQPRPELRVTAAVQGASKPTKDGSNSYIVCSMFPDTINMAGMQALGAWSTDAELQVELADYVAAFAERKAAIEAKM